jgi:uncharacterized protein (TIGR02594 family)
MRLDIFEAIVRGVWDKCLIQEALNRSDTNLHPIVVDGYIGKKTRQRASEIILEKFVMELEKSFKAYNGIDFDWIRVAFNELGVKEWKSGSNPEVEKYHDAAKISWANDDIPWCASFVAYCYKKSGIDFTHIKNPASSLAWLKFGYEVNKPLYGSIAIKKRKGKGKGHIAFVIGISKDMKYLYALGGNQNDMVCIRKYKVKKFISFRMPIKYYSRLINRDLKACNSKKES